MSVLTRSVSSPSRFVGWHTTVASQAVKVMCLACPGARLRRTCSETTLVGKGSFIGARHLHQHQHMPPPQCHPPHPLPPLHRTFHPHRPPRHRWRQSSATGIVAVHSSFNASRARAAAITIHVSAVSFARTVAVLLRARLAMTAAMTGMAVVTTARATAVVATIAHATALAAMTATGTATEWTT